MQVKLCKECNKEKTVDCFHKDNSQKDNLYSICKNCRKQRRHKLVNFGITDNDLVGFIKSSQKLRVNLFSIEKDRKHTSKPRRFSQTEIEAYEKLKLGGGKKNN